MLDVVIRAFRRAKGIVGFGPASNQGTSSFLCDLDAARALINNPPSALERIFLEEAERKECLKWLHYLQIYDKVLGRYRGTAFNMLEIGVFDGMSLRMWRKYFGSDAKIFGIDINPDCAAKAVPPTQVRIGSQDDPEFLDRVVIEMGGLDVVLDDGSHLGRHQIATFRCLFPKLRVGGLYLIEDLHTAYWPDRWEGGYGRRGTGIDLIKTLLDDLHGWYHPKSARYVMPYEINSITIFDSIAVIERGNNQRPVLARTGPEASSTP
jgi:hypothetical protein